MIIKIYKSINNASSFLNFDSRWKYVARFRLGPFYPHEKDLINTGLKTG
jgi:hypothetical protein